MRKRNHRANALGSGQGQARQAAPACRAFWVDRGALCVVAPTRSVGMPQRCRQTEPERAILSPDPGLTVPTTDPLSPRNAICLWAPSQGQVTSWNLSTTASVGSPSRSTQLRKFFREQPHGLTLSVGDSCQVSKGHKDRAACSIRQSNQGEAPPDTQIGRSVLTSMLD